MTPDFETIKKLWTTGRDTTIPERRASKASDEVESLLPEDLWDEMAQFETDTPGFENAFRKYYAKTETAETRTVSPVSPEVGVPGGYPAVLPWPPDIDGIVDFPSYGIDFRGIPHGLSGKGRKLGERPIDRFWYKRPDGTRRFICRYKLTDRHGKRQNVYPVQCFMSRTLAERIHRNGEI
jgi:hypothetical protein